MEIYLITNTVNGKQYVGQTTKTANHRFTEHCKDARNKTKSIVQKAIAKYGADAFVVTKLKDCVTQEELIVKKLD